MTSLGPTSLSLIRKAIVEAPFQGRIHIQIDSLIRKEGSNGKPYWELKLRDAEGSLVLRAWNDTLAFAQCEKLRAGQAVEVSGEFYLNGPYGLDARRWELRLLEDSECSALFEGPGQEGVLKDFQELEQTVQAVGDPRLRSLALLFLQEYGKRFCRCAAARSMHHAHRGGLCRHTAQMMRTAKAIVASYSHLNSDLLLVGVLFHDSGKLWEVCPPEAGFQMSYDLRGELLGHISIGIELINALWRKLPLESWKDLVPSSEEVRLHLLHLIASHHGEYQYGSPILPKTPEALALHYIDNLDARLEMLAAATTDQVQIAPGVFEHCRPLNIRPIAALPRLVAPPPS